MDYDAIVIGSGFGATVAVSRLLERQQRVLMLERGTWWLTPEKLGKPPAHQEGDPPALPDWAREHDHPVQYWPRPDHKEGLLDLFASVRSRHNRDGLYQYSRFKHCDVLTASGVGGGSLIYSNATLQPEAGVLERVGLNLTQADYDRALEWTRKYRGLLNRVPTKIPLPASREAKLEDLGDEDYLYLDRARELRDAAAKVSKKRKLDPPAPWRPLELAIAEYHEDGEGNKDVNGRHTFCERQGRCVLGCLPQARHTLNKTLYRRWVSNPNSGLELRPLSEVRQIRQVEDGYEVSYRDHWKSDGDERGVRTRAVFLGAGVLGSNEILLRSRDQGLPLSDELGKRFSVNGNFAGFCIDTKNTVQSSRGPINTCHVDFHIDGRLRVIEDAGIPSMLAAVASTGVHILDSIQSDGGFFTWAHAKLFEREMKTAFLHNLLPDLRSFLPHIPDTYKPDDSRTEAETLANIFFFNCMGEDEANGRFTLEDDKLELGWDERPGDQKVFSDIEGLLQDFSEAMEGRYVAMPLWRGFDKKKLTITHPLGGCRVGHDSSDGVVDEHGRVFDGNKPEGSTETLPNLYVVDGSTIPGAIVAHPTLTIMAQALKTMEAALDQAPAPAEAPQHA